MVISYGNFTDEIFDKLVHILDTADKKALREIAVELCSNIIAGENAIRKQSSNVNLDRFILLLVNKEAILNVSIKSWAIILASSGSSNGKKLVIDNHPEGQRIKEQIADDIAIRCEESWSGYAADEKQRIIKKVRRRLAGEVEYEDTDNQSNNIINFLKNNKKTLMGVTVAGICSSYFEIKIKKKRSSRNC